MTRKRRSPARVLGRVVVLAATLLVAVLAGGSHAGAAADTTAAGAPAVAAGPVTLATPNGCGSTYTWWIVPDRFRQYDQYTNRLVGTAVFTETCNAHDRCYSSTSSLARATCDGVFKRDLQADCRRAFASGSRYRANCYRAVDVYYSAVRTFGKSAYKGRGNPA